MQAKDRELLEELLVEGRCASTALMHGRSNPRASVRSFDWELKRIVIPGKNIPTRNSNDLASQFPNDYRKTSFVFASIPHNTTYSQIWCDFAIAMGYLPEVEDVIIMPPSLGEYFQPEELEGRGFDILYMEQGRDVVRNVTDGDLVISNRLPSRDIPEYKLVFSGKLPLNIQKLLERNSRRIVAEKLRYAFRSKFISDMPGKLGNSGRNEWDVFQHAANISLGHLRLDRADDLPPESPWERDMLDLLSQTDLKTAQVSQVEETIADAVSALEIYEAFWLSALEGAPVAPMQYMFLDENRDEIERWSEILGVKPLVESYAAGISEDDVIGGEVQHGNVKIEVEL